MTCKLECADCGGITTCEDKYQVPGGYVCGGCAGKYGGGRKVPPHPAERSFLTPHGSDNPT